MWYMLAGILTSGVFTHVQIKQLTLFLRDQKVLYLNYSGNTLKPISQGEKAIKLVLQASKISLHMNQLSN